MDACESRPPDVLVGADHHALCWLYADGGQSGAAAASAASASATAGSATAGSATAGKAGMEPG
jgi:hypothetical protein